MLELRAASEGGSVVTMPVVSCCKPRLLYAPSGVSWYHATDCARDPNTKIFRPPARETRHLRLVQRGEDSRASVRTLAPRGAVHPACKAAAEEGRTPCAGCAWRMGLHTEGAAYVEHWIDER